MEGFAAVSILIELLILITYEVNAQISKVLIQPIKDVKVVYHAIVLILMDSVQFYFDYLKFIKINHFG